MDQTINTLMEMSERHKRYADTQEGERRAMYLRFANACVEAAGRLGTSEPQERARGFFISFEEPPSKEDIRALTHRIEYLITLVRRG